jgi:PAS domain S-box-containing protein
MSIRPKSPQKFDEIFKSAQKTVKNYFENLKLNPENGSIEINDQRYVLIRASSLSSDFFENIKNLYAEKSEQESFNLASTFLFDIGHLIGIQDAREFHKKMNLKDPIEKLAAGPVHFSYSGWAFVDILEDSNPTPDENFFLKYNHPYSFEADSWIKSGKKAEESVCTMNAAYSSGWCSESFGIPLTAVEISCRAKGDENCTFIMAPPTKIDGYLDKVIKEHKIKKKPIVPFFFERKKIEENLLKSDKLFNDVQKISKIGSWEFDVETNDLIWSDELYNIFGISKDTDKAELFSKYISKVNKEDSLQLNKHIEDAINLGKDYSIVHSINSGKKIRWIFGSGVPVKDEKGKVVKIIGYAQDVTDRKSTELELNQFFRLSNDLLCIADFSGFLTKLSVGWRKIFGYSHEEMSSVPFISFVHPDDEEKTLNAFNELIHGEFIIGFENRYRCKDGTYRTLSWNASPDKLNSQIFCIVRDVTSEHEAEQKLMNTLHEREVLLKEVHHRVKNNLQIISSLLNLQSNYIENKTFKLFYRESQNRIKSIASVHELLYQSNNIGKIDFKSYLEKLASDLLYSYNGDENLVHVVIKTKEKFNIDTSIPLGLLINEIFSNSLKHGLKNKRGDSINITIHKISENKFELNILDNGIGFSFKNTHGNTDSLGLMLIEELSGQLNGEINQVETKKGTHYRLIFSEN